MSRGYLRATLDQLAWYIERDGGRIEKVHADGSQTVYVPLSGGYVRYLVPAEDVPELRRKRDQVFRLLAAKRRERSGYTGDAAWWER